MPLKVLVSTFGSAGDLFPVVPAVVALREAGHDVRCAVPRALGLYLRSAGLPTIALGDGSELQVMHDPDVVTTRFEGWASWRWTVTRYVAPTLDQHVAALERIVPRWRPDVVVTTSFAAGARVVAHRHGLPTLEVSIYPQHLLELPDSRVFGRRLRDAVRAALDASPSDELVGWLAWGEPRRTVVLSDPVLLGGFAGRLPDLVGFPYWDQAPERPDDLERIEAWLGASDRPVVAVTLGSFLGVRQARFWRDATEAADGAGVRAVLVGPRRPSPEARLDEDGEVLTVGYVRLSRLAGRVAAVVHHGGIGTTYAALAAGTPAVVVPQAFDQGFNAALVDALGVGLDGRRQPLATALERAVDDASFGARAREVAARLIPPDQATRQLVDRIVAAAGGGAG